MLLDGKALGLKGTNDDTDPVPGFHLAAFVGESHPIYFPGFRGAALTELTDLFQRRDDEADTGLRIKEGRFIFLVIENFSLGRVEDAVAEADDLSGFDRFYRKVIDAPNQAVVFTRALGELSGAEAGGLGGVGVGGRNGGPRGSCLRSRLRGRDGDCETADENKHAQRRLCAGLKFS